MAFDNRDIKPRKKSYYPFSKNYPGRRSGTSYAIGESRTRKKKEKRKKIVFSVFLVFFFVLVFGLLYCTENTAHFVCCVFLCG